MTNQKKEWALILGGSSGLGLATAKKLAAHGYNLFIVHRDRRADLQDIESDFKPITATGISLESSQKRWGETWLTDGDGVSFISDNSA